MVRTYCVYIVLVTLYMVLFGYVIYFYIRVCVRVRIPIVGEVLSRNFFNTL